jgi:chromosome segregation ATPase
VSELRHRKSEAREAGKLLEDKKALEAKLREVQGTLELVQGQRNELRQEVKDLKATLAQASDAEQVSDRLRMRIIGGRAAIPFEFCPLSA